MKSKILIILVVLNMFFQSCGDGDCEGFACFTPPQRFTFELVDKNTRENLFTNETFKSSEITVTDLNENRNIEFDFTDENDLNVIQINSIGWESEKVNVLINVSGNDILNLIVDAERTSEDCCEFTNYNDIQIENAEFELNNETGVYTILINQ